MRTVIVDGEPLLLDGRLTRLDEAALRAEAEAVMPGFRRDFAALARRSAQAVSYLLDANRRVGQHDVGLDRFAPG